MRNLLDETTHYIESSGISLDDIITVVANNTYCNWEEFSEIAKEVNYDGNLDEYERNHITYGLIIYTTKYIIYRDRVGGIETWSIIPIFEELEFGNKTKTTKNDLLTIKD